MLDRHLLPPLQAACLPVAQALVRCGVRANTVTVWASAVGLAACAAVLVGHFLWALALLLISRLLDGLDGSVARLTQPTAGGAFADITLDFVFYAAWPLAFGIYNPAQNALAAAALLASFVCSGTSFLAFAAVAKTYQKLPTLGSNELMGGPVGKGFVFLGGLAEGTETIVCFAAMACWPQHFAPLAYGFALMCFLSAALRIAQGWRVLGRHKPGDVPPDGPAGVPPEPSHQRHAVKASSASEVW